MRNETILKQEIKGRQKLLKANDVAEVLNISSAYVYKLISTGELPSVHIGRSVRVRPQDLDVFIVGNIYFSNK